MAGALAAGMCLGACGGAVASSSAEDKTGSDSTSGAMTGGTGGASSRSTGGPASTAGNSATTGIGAGGAGEPSNSSSSSTTGTVISSTGYSTTGTVSAQGDATGFGSSASANCTLPSMPGPAPADANPLTNAIVTRDSAIADHTGWVFNGLTGPNPALFDFIVGGPSPTCALPFGDPATACTDASAIVTLGFTTLYPGFFEFPGPGIDINFSERDACGASSMGTSAGGDPSYPCVGYLQVLGVTDNTVDFRLGGLENFGKARFNGYYRGTRCPSASP
jgi:hypothetical protein